MLLILQITQLDYGDAALCALSALRGRAEDPGSAASRLLEALESVPPELIRRLLDAIPDRDKAALAASLARENEARIRELAGEAAHRAGIALSVKELSVSDGLELRAELVDIEKERARIEKELDKARAQLEAQNKKLANESFVSRAPEAVVNAERERAEKAKALIANLEESLAKLK